jgi:hypothetical protein
MCVVDSHTMHCKEKKTEHIVAVSFSYYLSTTLSLLLEENKITGAEGPVNPHFRFSISIW